MPSATGIEEVLRRFDRVMTVENGWSDSPESEIIDRDNRRYSGLAWLLRARYLVDVDCWSEARGQPIKPGTVARVVGERLAANGPHRNVKKR